MQQQIGNPLNYFMEKTMNRNGRETQNKSAVTAAERLMMLLAIAGLCFLAYDVAHAGGSPKPLQEQGQHQDQETDVDVDVSAGGGSALASATGGEAAAISGSTNEGNDNSNTINTENNSSNVVMVPNNNTESCVRVWGLAFGRNGESGALGIPWRSAKCDYEQAADDAFAAGEREWGWFWKCQNKNLAKSFKLDGDSWDEAMHRCHTKAVGHVTAFRQIDELREHIATLESQIAQHNDRMNTVAEECRESAERAHATCVDK